MYVYKIFIFTTVAFIFRLSGKWVAIHLLNMCYFRDRESRSLSHMQVDSAHTSWTRNPKTLEWVASSSQWIFAKIDTTGSSLPTQILYQAMSYHESPGLCHCLINHAYSFYYFPSFHSLLKCGSCEPHHIFFVFLCDWPHRMSPKTWNCWFERNMHLQQTQSWENTERPLALTSPMIAPPCTLQECYGKYFLFSIYFWT